MERIKFSYTFKKSKRLKKNLRFSLMPGDSSVIVVSIPIFMSVKSAQKVVKKNSEKIGKSFLREFLKNRKTEDFIESKNNQILYLGKWYKKSYCESVNKYIIKEEEVVLNPLFDEILFYKLEAKRVFTKIIDTRQFSTGLKINRLFIRNQKTRWGTCSSKGNISLNLKLIQAPLYVIDYVAVHELVHLEIKGHNKFFWQRVQQLCSNYKESKKYLNDNKNILMCRL